MGDRNDYMREYMRERRARLKAERLAAGGEIAPSRQDRDTEEEQTEGSGLQGLIPVVFLLAILIVGCVQAWRYHPGQE